MELNQVTVKDVNLPSSINNFSEEFAGYDIFSFIDYFLGYNQVKLDKKSSDFMPLITLLGLMQITTLSQGTTNFFPPFVQIVFKIWIPHLEDQAKSFLNDLGVKRPKTKYNNKEVALGVKSYILEYIQNFDKIFANLEKIKVILAGTRS